MARRPGRGAKTSPADATPAEGGDPRERIIDAMMRLAAEHDFGGIGLADIAAEAEVPLATLRRNFDGKLGILAAFSRRIDEQVLDKGPAEGEGARDRLFEMLMRRFEALVPYREALRRLVRSARRDLRLAYSDVLSVFLEDDDDLARTMARLDRSLRRGERAVEWLDGICAFIPGLGGRLNDRSRRSGGDEAVL